MTTILLTGAAGYIASHTWLALQAAGYGVVGVDDFSNSSPRVLKRLRSLSGREVVFERASVCDAAAAHLFNVELTPNYNWAHRNHFHLEVTPSVTWFMVH